MQKTKLLILILALASIFFVIGLYAGGWVWLKGTGNGHLSPSLTTLFEAGDLTLDKRKMLLPWAWCVTVAITFFPVGVSLFALMGTRDGNRRDLHGNARFATPRELQKIWYDTPEKGE